MIPSISSITQNRSFTLYFSQVKNRNPGNVSKSLLYFGFGATSCLIDPPQGHLVGIPYWASLMKAFLSCSAIRFNTCLWFLFSSFLSVSYGSSSRLSVQWYEELIWSVRDFVARERDFGREGENRSIVRDWKRERGEISRKSSSWERREKRDEIDIIYISYI